MNSLEFNFEPHQKQLFNDLFQGCDRQVYQREMTRIRAMLNDESRIDAFALAWGALDKSDRYSILKECYIQYPHVFPKGAAFPVKPDSSPQHFDGAQQRRVLQMIGRFSRIGVVAGCVVAAEAVEQAFIDARKEEMKGVAL